MRVIIDCGAWEGRSIGRLRDRFDPSGSTVVHSFEPNPIFHERLSSFENVVIHPEAVWVSDGHVDFYLQEVDPKYNRAGRGQGHSLMPQKANIDLGNKIKVPSIDFSEWISDNFVESDEIILKMDIEGAEYEVLGKMVRDGTIRLINKLLVEFHHDKYPQLASLNEYEALIASIPISVEAW